MGHEATGVVEATGSLVSGLKSGQHVLINPIIACGYCDSCLRGAENLCRNAGLFGREIDGSLGQLVSLASRFVYPLPRGLPLADATLIETLATVRHAQRRLALAEGESVVVLGQGTPGRPTHASPCWPARTRSSRSRAAAGSWTWRSTWARITRSMPARRTRCPKCCG
jgi:threonine dehydrogenase-like Zn-dependent dehydrogenase